MKDQKQRTVSGGRGKAHAAAAFMSVLLLLAALTSVASAATLRSPTAFSPIDGSSIGPPFHGTTSVAVDEASGNIFAPLAQNSFSQSALYILNSEGGIPSGVASPYMLTFSEEHELEVEAGVAFDNSSSSPAKGTLYLAAATSFNHFSDFTTRVEKFTRNPATEKYEAAGELAAIPPFETRQDDVTVDDAGNVYVSVPIFENGFGRIVKFSPGGTQLKQIKVPLGASSLAVDGAGDLFVLIQGADGVDSVRKYPVDGLGEFDESNFVELSSEFQLEGIGIDRSSNTLFVSINSSQSEIDEYDASTLIEKGSFGAGQLPSNPAAIDVNESAGVIYLPMFTSIAAFNLAGATIPNVGTMSPSEVSATRMTLHGIVNPLGVPVSECVFEVPELSVAVPCEGPLPTDSSDHAVSAQISGLSPNKRYAYRLVVTSANGVGRSGLQVATTAPIATTAAATAITAAGATLNGIVRTEGTAVTECKFEYGLSIEYGTTVPCSPEAGAISPDFEPHSVSADLAGLLVGTTYHYRVVASGGLGSEAGKDRTFTVLGPSVEGTSLSGLTDSSVRLEALINPRGKATTYHFEYGSQGPCSANPCTSAPVPDGSVGAGNGGVEVAQLVQGLNPKTTYYYRVVVTSPDGTGHGVESTFTTYEALSGFGPCPDEQFRANLPSARLPDCRVYEQASPIAKNGNDADGGNPYQVQASVSGDGITSQTYGGMPGSEGAQVYPPYLSLRGSEGWSTQGLLPPPTFGDKVQMIGWTPDLAYSFSRGMFADSDRDPSGELDSAFLVRSSATRQIQQVTPYLNGVGFGFAAASADDSKIFFEAEGKNVNLTGNAATSKDNLYLYEPASEELSLVGVLPNGTAPPGGSFAGPFDWWSLTSSESLLHGGALGRPSQSIGNFGYFLERMHAISTDGSRAFFTAGATGQIYLRYGIGSEEPETTVVSASQRTTPDPNGAKPAIFLGAASDGSKAFFMSCQKLTDDSTAHSTAANVCDTPDQGQDLYAYDVESEQLEDLTVDTEDPQGAEVVGMIGNSDDGSVVYFVANGDLDGSGGPAEAGDCEHVSLGSQYQGSCNLYAWHDGSTKFVARLGAADSEDWGPRPEGLTEIAPAPESQVSPDGAVVVFSSHNRLTTYDNEAKGPCPPGSVKICAEYYRYRLGDPGPTCVTCNPTGAPPIASPTISTFSAPISVGLGHPSTKRFVSASGNQVFFETSDKLVAADVNGDNGCEVNTADLSKINPTCQDVYEWEAPGAGTCTESSPAYSDQDAGCLYLLSTGTAKTASFLGDASASGDSVFIFTRDSLVPTDKDGQTDIYDVRVGGGLASQNPPPPGPPCEGEACRSGTGSPPNIPSAGSAGFHGQGNPPAKRCPKGKVRKGGKCVKRHSPHHKRRGHHKPKRGSQKRAGADRGGAR